MSGLNEQSDIQTCREHHAHLVDLLANLPALEPENAAPLTERLRLFKTVLLRHLRFEDDQLYPRLQRSADPVVVETATRYQREMGGLAAQCVAFFDAWATPQAVENAFGAFLTDWAAVRVALERRIHAEDTELYEMAERTI